jgi:hypothetical protein
MKRHIETERFCRLEIYNQFEFRWGLNRKIAWFFTFQNAIGVGCRKPKLITLVSSVGLRL